MASSGWLAVVAAVAVVVAVEGSAVDLACSLNGRQVSGQCNCDAPWRGVACSQLDIKPRPPSAVPAIYGHSPNVTSWGGNVVKGDDGLYHLYVSEMVGGCGLVSWGTHSRIIHATAPSLDVSTPFKFSDVALPVWAHNAAPIRAPSSHTECPGCYYLFHIGDGATSHPPYNCTNGNSPSDAAVGHKYDAPRDWFEAETSGAGGLVHRSKSPYGPWEALPSSVGCNNPAPAFAKNGTLFVLCSSSTVYRGDDVTGGKWDKVISLDLGNTPWRINQSGTYVRVEDPYLWNDANGNWHLFSHRYDYRDGWPPNPNQTEPVLVSAHAYSTNMYEWHYNTLPQPFDPWTFSEDGARVNFSTFERPHLVFNEAGIPTHSIHGASPVWAQYGDHHPCEVCPARPGSEHSCVVCKSSQYYSYTYTLLQELKVP